MAKYRQLYTEFWSDSFILELTPEEKYFYLYLMTNIKTTQSGIYGISKRTIETDTGYNRDTVEKLIKRFCDYKKILYCDETKELMIINWIKYNVPNSCNVIKCVQNELLKVKHSEFVKILFDKCLAVGLDVEKIFENYDIEAQFDCSFAKDRGAIDSLSEKVDKLPIEFTLERSSEKIIKPLIRGMKGAYKVLGSNKEEVISNKQEVINKKEEEEEEEEEEEVRNKKEALIKNNSAAANDDEGLINIIKTYEENIHDVTPLEYEKILEFTRDVTSEVIIMAIEEAVVYNAKTMQYITKIINSWISQGIRTAEGVKGYQKKWTDKKNKGLGKNVKKGGFCDFEQRSYDYDALEQKLLGNVDNADLE